MPLEKFTENPRRREKPPESFEAEISPGAGVLPKRLQSVVEARLDRAERDAHGLGNLRQAEPVHKTEEQREVLMLRFVDGLSLAEIGEAMDIPLGTVKSRLHNALQTLRQDERTRAYFDR